LVSKLPKPIVLSSPASSQDPRELTGAVWWLPGSPEDVNVMGLGGSLGLPRAVPCCARHIGLDLHPIHIGFQTQYDGVGLYQTQHFGGDPTILGTMGVPGNHSIELPCEFPGSPGTRS
jgi:hypothetical protein